MRKGAFFGHDALAIIAAHTRNSSSLNEDDKARSLKRIEGEAKRRSYSFVPSLDDDDEIDRMMPVRDTLADVKREAPDPVHIGVGAKEEPANGGQPR